MWSPASRTRMRFEESEVERREARRHAAEPAPTMMMSYVSWLGDDDIPGIVAAGKQEFDVRDWKIPLCKFIGFQLLNNVDFLYG
jgi:hypothetical protein